MSDYKIQKVMIGGLSYSWDYNSLIGLPDFYSKLQGGPGIDIQTDPETGQLYISVASEVSQDIERLLASVFPVKVEVTSTTGIGNFEIGTSVDPEVRWNITGTYNSYYIIPSYKKPAGYWINLNPEASPSGSYRFTDTETDRSYKIAIRIDDSYTVEIGPFETKFLKPRYYGQVLGEPSEITQGLIESLARKEQHLVHDLYTDIVSIYDRMGIGWDSIDTNCKELALLYLRKAAAKGEPRALKEVRRLGLG